MKYTLEEAKAIFKEINLTLLSDTYKSVDTPMVCKDENGYKYYRTLRTVIDKKENCVKVPHLFSTKNPFAVENMYNYIVLNVINGTKLLATNDDYKHSNDKLLFYCGECGKTYRKRFLDFKHDKYKVCADCYKKYETLYPHRQHKDIEFYKEKAKELNLTIIQENGITYHSRIEVEDKDGYKGYVTASRMLNSNSTFEKFSVRNPYTIFNMRHYAELNKMDCFIPEQKFQGDKKMMKFVCSCGNIYETSLIHFLYDKKSKCNECRVKQSNIAEKVELYLKTYNIVYQKEKTFDDCRSESNKLLYFDFYISNKNLCIEVDGLQHYKPIAFGGNKEKARIQFEKTKKNDDIKTNYCLENNITLLRLPFWKIENSTKYIDELNEIFFPLKSSEL